MPVTLLGFRPANQINDLTALLLGSRQSRYLDEPPWRLDVLVQSEALERLDIADVRVQARREDYIDGEKSVIRPHREIQGQA